MLCSDELSGSLAPHGLTHLPRTTRFPKPSAPSSVKHDASFKNDGEGVIWPFCFQVRRFMRHRKILFLYLVSAFPTFGPSWHLSCPQLISPSVCSRKLNRKIKIVSHTWGHLDFAGWSVSVRAAGLAQALAWVHPTSALFFCCFMGVTMTLPRVFSSCHLHERP